jgi:predicted transcriptional regulator
MLVHLMIDELKEEVNLLERHLIVFGSVLDAGPIGIVKLAQQTDYPHHKIRYSLRILEEQGLIEPTSTGAVPTDQADEFVATLHNRLDELTARIEDMKVDGG